MTTLPPIRRITFDHDPDPSLDGSDGKPLPESREHYETNPFIDHGSDRPSRKIPYEEYLTYHGNPDRHTVVTAVVEHQCRHCQAWHVTGSLCGIDFMDDSPEVLQLKLPGTYSEAEAKALQGYPLKDLMDEIDGEESI